MTTNDRFHVAILGEELAHDLEDICHAHYNCHPDNIMRAAIIKFVSDDITQNKGIGESYRFQKELRMRKR